MHPPIAAEDATVSMLELALQNAPSNAQLRRSYFVKLFHLARTHVGLTAARLPELSHPLFFRCGTSDILNMLQIFQRQEYGSVIPHTPARILDLGAYAGYAAVFLANRFPAAEILAVEPSPANYRMLQMNTLPYRAIRTLQAAVWDRTARLEVAARDTGDWGNILRQADGGDIAGFSVADLLASQAWRCAEFVKCDIEGSEVRVFSDPRAPWLDGIDTLAIETHDRMIPGCSAAVAACFPTATYDRSRSGELDVFARRTPRRIEPRRLPPVKLLHAGPGLSPTQPRNLAPQPWAFFLFDDTCCQLHPNPPGALPAQLALAVRLDGQRRFSARIRIAHPASQDVVFKLEIRDASDGRTAFSAQRRVAAATSQDWRETLPALSGGFEVVLQVEMAPGAAQCGYAWAQWLDPVIA